jgi:hypothetical protein
MGRVEEEANRLKREAAALAERRRREVEAERARLQREQGARDAELRREQARKIREVEAWAEPIIVRANLRKLLAEVRDELWKCGSLEESASDYVKHVRLRSPHLIEYIRRHRAGEDDRSDFDWQRVEDYSAFELYPGPDSPHLVFNSLAHFRHDQDDNRRSPGIPIGGDYRAMESFAIQCLAEDWNTRRALGDPVTKVGATDRRRFRWPR